ncbi:sensory box histidine kinase/response regulator [Cystobacter fuscus DSM 2262]|uniref:Sensory/regulatory protein RpfC n=1 Tax=Cystobacter fuscus (strain ATCC 25194 / DSM 2262 / NBRC 100088 / M29) TaxID=1242864 RepID=S9QEH3_CYSF2|nr:PAS domain-containing hybrid sensor histidine kinase/response regulator [Cystobacter fuscus]EPX59714.1 sensory box histidine kinase/response regulator [Cystobacter fuscus DSM 2262]
MRAPPEKDLESPGALIEESTEDLYENAPCGYLSTRLDGTIIKVNQTFLNWTGYSREELLAGKRFQDVLAIGSKIFHETHYAPLLRMQGFVSELNLELVHKDRQKIPVLINTLQRRDAAGNPLVNRTTVFNISERKKYEQELLLARKKAEQATKAKADFLSMISHEIRTPMNAIVGISNLLRETRLSSEQQEYVRILGFSSENLLNLLNNILDFSKIEAGKVTLEERGFDIRQLIHNTVYSLGVKAEEKGLKVQVDLDERVPACLRGDPIKIGQLLTNLLSNAIKFTERGGVTVALRVQELFPDAASLEFRVTDTGIGISEDRLGPIFEEFTQASYETSMKYGGTGLGLAINRKLLELYGSKMSVQSTPGAGSSFSFNLRLKIGQDAGQPEGPREGAPDEQTLRGVKVLVAEDNEVNVFVIERLLRRWGVEFEVVANGHRAMEKVMANAYDLVLMDLQMPELDGYDATRKIRSLPEERFRRLPIIALTASSRIGMDDRLEHAGFTDFVGKPFKLEELFAKLARYASRALPLQERRQPVWARAQEVADSALPSRNFNLEGFRKLTAGDPEGLVELLSITLTGCEHYKRDFQDALEAGSLKQFKFHTHKIKMTLELLQAHALRAALKEGKALLSEQGDNPARIQSIGQVIQRELDAIIDGLKMELGKG